MKHRDVSRGRAPAVREGTYVAGGTRDIDSRLDTERATCHRTRVHTNGARHRGAGPGARDGEQRHVGPPRLTRQICLRSAHDDPHRTPRQNGVVLVVATAHRYALQGASVPAIGGGTRSALAAADLCARSAGGARSGSDNLCGWATVSSRQLLASGARQVGEVLHASEEGFSKGWLTRCPAEAS
jgi:hypothetical protein